MHVLSDPKTPQGLSLWRPLGGGATHPRPQYSIPQCYAEVLLARAALTFLEDPDSIVSFIKGAITIRNSYGYIKLANYCCLFKMS